MAASESELIDPQAVAQGEALGLLARQVVEGFLSGEHKSPFRGFAVEFTQHREYTPGDDLRHLDWKVLARNDRFYLKQYEQETNFVCHLLVDGSASMAYGGEATRPGDVLTSGSKLHYACRLAASLAYLVLHQRDAVSLLLFDRDVRRYVPRTTAPGSIHTLMRLLATYMPATGEAGATAVGAVLHQLAATTPRRGIVVVISDLLDDEAAVLRGIQHVRFVGHEVIVFHTLHPDELTLPFRGNVEFVGLEGGTPLLTRPSELRRTYLAEVEGFMTRTRLACESNRCHYVLADTSRPLAETLAGYLALRERTHVR
ncbi:MAG: DUF58 domain-containing protein [Tepidisphaerales bacterium]